MRWARFCKVFAMLLWRLAAVNSFLIIAAPSVGSRSPWPLLGIAALAAGVLVFGMRRTLLVFPLVRLVLRANPMPTEGALRAGAEAAAERARRDTPEYREAQQREAERRGIALRRRQELEHAERIERLRSGPGALDTVRPSPAQTPGSDPASGPN